MRNGIVFPQVPLAPLTDETGSGLWPTPVAQDDNKTPEAHLAMKARMKGGPRKTITSLNVMVKATERQMWPTPHANCSTGAGTQGRAGGLNLQTAVRESFLTPAARDYRSPNAKPYSERGGGKKGEQLPNAIGGQLNPTWVEWLMGFPLGWTDLKPQAMP